MALGITWILDGLEVTLAGALTGALKESPTLRFSNTDIGLASSAYLAGAVLGAVFFGWLTDRLGRKKLFFITLAVYLTPTAATAFSWNLWSFCLFRFLTGAGIGGEYTAINSTIQELIPARVRGWTDLVINGSFWVGAALGAAGSIVLLDPAIFAPDLGWRIAFFIGAALGLVILVMRLWIPESPRWLMTHGRASGGGGGRRRHREELREPRRQARRHGVAACAPACAQPYAARARCSARCSDAHRQRALVGLTLMAAQAFFYNAIFFTYALILTDFYGDRRRTTSAGSCCPSRPAISWGRSCSGRLFDTVGRRPMIAFTYAISGLLLAGSGYLFQQGLLTARAHDDAPGWWCSSSPRRPQARPT